MTIRKVLTYPNPALRKPARTVSLEELGTHEFRNALSDLEETLSTIVGADALAANQIGINMRMFIMRSDDRDLDARVRINPIFVTHKFLDTEEQLEGCLSFPDMKIPKRRFSHLTISYTTLGGLQQSEEVTGFTARLYQHEIDHLDGRLFIDHLSDNEKRRIAMKIAKRGNGNVR